MNCSFSTELLDLGVQSRPNICLIGDGPLLLANCPVKKPGWSLPGWQITLLVAARKMALVSHIEVECPLKWLEDAMMMMWSASSVYFKGKQGPKLSRGCNFPLPDPCLGSISHEKSDGCLTAFSFWEDVSFWQVRVVFCLKSLWRQWAWAWVAQTTHHSGTAIRMDFLHCAIPVDSRQHASCGEAVFLLQEKVMSSWGQGTVINLDMNSA